MRFSMKTAISQHTTIVQAKEQLCSDLQGEVVILNFKNGEYYGLNAVGARIWNLIRQPKSVNEILNVLLQEYEAAPFHCQNDLMALLQELAAEELIEIQG